MKQPFGGLGFMLAYALPTAAALLGLLWWLQRKKDSDKGRRSTGNESNEVCEDTRRSTAVHTLKSKEHQLWDGNLATDSFGGGDGINQKFYTDPLKQSVDESETKFDEKVYPWGDGITVATGSVYSRDEDHSATLTASARDTFKFFAKDADKASENPDISSSVSDITNHSSVVIQAVSNISKSISDKAEQSRVIVAEAPESFTFVAAHTTEKSAEIVQNASDALKASSAEADNIVWDSSDEKGKFSCAKNDAKGQTAFAIQNNNVSLQLSTIAANILERSIDEVRNASPSIALAATNQSATVIQNIKGDFKLSEGKCTTETSADGNKNSSLTVKSDNIGQSVFVIRDDELTSEVANSLVTNSSKVDHSLSEECGTLAQEVYNAFRLIEEAGLETVNIKDSKISSLSAKSGTTDQATEIENNCDIFRSPLKEEDMPKVTTNDDMKSATTEQSADNCLFLEDFTMRSDNTLAFSLKDIGATSQNGEHGLTYKQKDLSEACVDEGKNTFSESVTVNQSVSVVERTCGDLTLYPEEAKFSGRIVNKDQNSFISAESGLTSQSFGVNQSSRGSLKMSSKEANIPGESVDIKRDFSSFINGEREELAMQGSDADEDKNSSPLVKSDPSDLSALVTDSIYNPKGTVLPTPDGTEVEVFSLSASASPDSLEESVDLGINDDSILSFKETIMPPPSGTEREMFSSSVSESPDSLEESVNLSVNEDSTSYFKKDDMMQAACLTESEMFCLSVSTNSDSSEESMDLSVDDDYTSSFKEADMPAASGTEGEMFSLPITANPDLSEESVNLGLNHDPTLSFKEAVRPPPSGTEEEMLSLSVSASPDSLEELVDFGINDDPTLSFKEADMLAVGGAEEEMFSLSVTANPDWSEESVDLCINDDPTLSLKEIDLAAPRETEGKIFSLAVSANPDSSEESVDLCINDNSTLSIKEAERPATDGTEGDMLSLAVSANPDSSKESVGLDINNDPTLFFKETDMPTSSGTEGDMLSLAVSANPDSSKESVGLDINNDPTLFFKETDMPTSSGTEGEMFSLAVSANPDSSKESVGLDINNDPTLFFKETDMPTSSGTEGEMLSLSVSTNTDCVEKSVDLSTVDDSSVSLEEADTIRTSICEDKNHGPSAESVVNVEYNRLCHSFLASKEADVPEANADKEIYSLPSGDYHIVMHDENTVNSLKLSSEELEKVHVMKTNDCKDSLPADHSPEADENITDFLHLHSEETDSLMTNRAERKDPLPSVESDVLSHSTIADQSTCDIKLVSEETDNFEVKAAEDEAPLVPAKSGLAGLCSIIQNVDDAFKSDSAQSAAITHDQNSSPETADKLAVETHNTIDTFRYSSIAEDTIETTDINMNNSPEKAESETADKLAVETHSTRDTFRYSSIAEDTIETTESNMNNSTETAESEPADKLAVEAHSTRDTFRYSSVEDTTESNMNNSTETAESETADKLAVEIHSTRDTFRYSSIAEDTIETTDSIMHNSTETAKSEPADKLAVETHSTRDIFRYSSVEDTIETTESNMNNSTETAESETADKLAVETHSTRDTFRYSSIAEDTIDTTDSNMHNSTETAKSETADKLAVETHSTRDIFRYSSVKDTIETTDSNMNNSTETAESEPADKLAVETHSTRDTFRYSSVEDTIETTDSNMNNSTETAESETADKPAVEAHNTRDTFRYSSVAEDMIETTDSNMKNSPETAESETAGKLTVLIQSANDALKYSSPTENKIEATESNISPATDSNISPLPSAVLNTVDQFAAISYNTHDFKLSSEEAGVPHTTTELSFITERDTLKQEARNDNVFGKENKTVEEHFLSDLDSSLPNKREDSTFELSATSGSTDCSSVSHELSSSGKMTEETCSHDHIRSSLADATTDSLTSESPHVNVVVSHSYHTNSNPSTAENAASLSLYCSKDFSEAKEKCVKSQTVISASDTLADRDSTDSSIHSNSASVRTSQGSSIVINLHETEVKDVKSAVKMSAADNSETVNGDEPKPESVTSKLMPRTASADEYDVKKADGAERAQSDNLKKEKDFATNSSISILPSSRNVSTHQQSLSNTSTTVSEKIQAGPNKSSKQPLLKSDQLSSNNFGSKVSKVGSSDKISQGKATSDKHVLDTQLATVPEDDGVSDFDATVFNSNSEESIDSAQGGSISEMLIPVPAKESVCYQFNFPSDLCGRLIGRGGKNIQHIKEQSGALVTLTCNPFTPDFQICCVQGLQSEVEVALMVIRKKFPQAQYPNFDMASLAHPQLTSVMVPEIMQLNLPEGVSIDIVVSAIVNAGHIFIQQPTHPTFPSLERLNHFMNACYNDQNAPMLPRPIEGGIICAAESEGQWYRAQIVQMYLLQDECDIKYVDYGGYTRVPISSLRQIRSDFMTLPFQATECYLANITPLQDEEYFSDKACDVLAELTSGKMLQGQVICRGDDSICYVHLYQVSGHSVLMINREMVNREVVRWIEIL